MNDVVGSNNGSKAEDERTGATEFARRD